MYAFVAFNNVLNLQPQSKKLLEKEIIFQSDLEGLIGKRPFEKQTTYAAYTSPNAKTAEIIEEAIVEETATESVTEDTEDLDVN